MQWYNSGFTVKGMLLLTDYCQSQARITQNVTRLMFLKHEENHNPKSPAGAFLHLLGLLLFLFFFFFCWYATRMGTPLWFKRLCR